MAQKQKTFRFWPPWQQAEPSPRRSKRATTAETKTPTQPTNTTSQKQPFETASAQPLPSQAKAQRRKTNPKQVHPPPQVQASPESEPPADSPPKDQASAKTESSVQATRPQTQAQPPGTAPAQAPPLQAQASPKTESPPSQAKASTESQPLSSSSAATQSPAPFQPSSPLVAATQSQESPQPPSPSHAATQSQAATPSPSPSHVTPQPPLLPHATFETQQAPQPQSPSDLAYHQPTIQTSSLPSSPSLTTTPTESALGEVMQPPEAPASPRTESGQSPSPANTGIQSQVASQPASPSHVATQSQAPSETPSQSQDATQPLSPSYVPQSPSPSPTVSGTQLALQADPQPQSPPKLTSQAANGTSSLLSSPSLTATPEKSIEEAVTQTPQAQVQPPDTTPAEFPPRQTQESPSIEPQASLPSSLATQSRVTSQPASPSRAATQDQTATQTQSPSRITPQPPSSSHTGSEAQLALQAAPQPQFLSELTPQPAVQAPSLPHSPSLATTPKKSFIEEVAQPPLVPENSLSIRPQLSVSEEELNPVMYQPKSQELQPNEERPFKNALSSQDQTPSEMTFQPNGMPTQTSEVSVPAAIASTFIATLGTPAPVQMSDSSIVTVESRQLFESVAKSEEKEMREENKQKISIIEEPRKRDFNKLLTVASGSTVNKIDISSRKLTALPKDIRGDISKFVHEMTLQNKKLAMDEKPISVITLAGQNRGASMQLCYESTKTEGEVQIHGAYEINPDEGTDATTDTEGSPAERSEDSEIQEGQTTEAHINTNMQGVNNSILFSSYITERNPGVHLVLPPGQT